MKIESWSKTSGELVGLIQSQLPTAVGNYGRDKPLFDEHVGLEASFRTSGYSNRQITELVQNASDAILASGARGNVELVLTPDAFYCANEGAAFTKKGVDSLTHAYVSTKRGQEIGRYGLGFKAVLAVTENAQIFSRSVSFEFGSESALRALRTVEPSASALPVLRTPTLVDVARARSEDPLLDELCGWATTVVKLPLLKMGSLKQQVKEFRAEFLLFAPSVSRLRVRIIDRSGAEDAVDYECKDLGEGLFDVSGPDRKTRRWRTLRAKHTPSFAAKNEVADAISRDSFYITYAAALDGRVDLGEFWANFPLETRTSASGIFNAPWALNEDRTNILLEKKYNEEIIDHFVELFLEILPSLSTLEDPSRHLLYMPSRTKEDEGGVDRGLITKIHYAASHAELIPTVDGSLVNGRSVRALHHSVPMPSAMFHLWAKAPHVPKDFPHPGCYATAQKRSRLRELHRGAFVPFDHKPGPNDPPAPSEVGVATWLGTLAQSPQTLFSRECIRAGAQIPAFAAEVSRAPMVALSRGGFVRLNESQSAFLPPGDGAEVEGYDLVHPDLVADPKVLSVLRSHNFKQLDPARVVEHLLRKLDADSPPREWESFWNAVDEVPATTAIRILRDSQTRGQEFKVPTADGTWADPRGLYDLSSIGIQTDPASTLKPRFMDLKLGEELGVSTGVQPKFPVIEEQAFVEYRTWAEEQACAHWGMTRDSVDGDLTFHWEYAPGPMGLLKDLQDDLDANKKWSKLLVEAHAETEWVVHFPDGDTAPVQAPHLWAVSEWGFVDTSLGVVERVKECVDPALMLFSRILPVPLPSVYGRLGLAREVAGLDPDYLRGRLQSFQPHVARHDSAGVVGQLLVAAAGVFRSEDEWPALVPAVVSDTVSPARAEHVYVARNDDEVEVLRHNGLAFVLVEDNVARTELIDASPLLLAEKAIRYEVRPIEPGQGVSITDLFPGIRPFISNSRQRLEVVRVNSVITRQTTPLGTTDEEHASILDSDTAYVTHDPYAADEQPALLRWLNEQADLGLSAAEISHVLEQLKDAQLAELRTDLLACRDDTERLSKLFTADELRAKLPVGLIDSLRALGKAVDEADLARLFVDAYGFDALNQLRDQLAMKGIAVPDTWAGSMRARQIVTDLGFDVRFAGERGTSKPTSEVVLGKPGLGPLHDYQNDAVKDIRFILRSRRGHAEKGLVELPTGAGKTRVAVEAVVRSFLGRDFDRSGHILWVAQSRELCEQAITSWSEVWREFSDNRSMAICRFYGQYKPDEPEQDVAVVVATDAMLREHLNDQAFAWIFDPLAVIIDEAHRAATATTYTQLLRRLGVNTQAHERPLIGLSATPFSGRNEEASRKLAERFGKSLIQTLGQDPIRELQERRILAQIDHEVLEGSLMTLADKEVESRLISSATLSRVGNDEQRMQRIVKHILSQPSDWKVLVFMPSVLSAQVLAAVLRSERVAADSVNGESSQRRREDVIDRFKHGDIQVLVNCDLLTQGFDAPSVRALYIAKPTLSESVYIQMVGRGLRGPKNKGSDRCLVVDLQDTVENGSIDLAYRGFESYWSRV